MRPGHNSTTIFASPLEVIQSSSHPVWQSTLLHIETQCKSVRLAGWRASNSSFFLDGIPVINHRQGDMARAA